MGGADHLLFPKDRQRLGGRITYYEAFGNQAGFCVRRNSWSMAYALLIGVQSKKSGPLEGTPPYYGNPTVIANIYGFAESDKKVRGDLRQQFADEVSSRYPPSEKDIGHKTLGPSL